MLTLKMIDAHSTEDIKAEVTKLVEIEAQRWLNDTFFYYLMHRQLPQLVAWRDEARAEIPGLEVEAGRLSAEVDRSLAAFDADKTTNKKVLWEEAKSDYGVCRAKITQRTRRVSHLNFLIDMTNNLEKPEAIL